MAKRKAYRLGVVVFLALAVLTAGEFVAARAAQGSLLLLFPIGIVKAALIVVYYMHVRSVWSQEVHE